MEAKLGEAALLERADRHLLRNYRPARFVLDRGEGCRLFDTEGRSYLDFCAGVAVCALGHAHPALTKAVAEQAGRVMHVSNYFYNAENVLLAEKLCAITGYHRAFFCNSGTEACEALLKLARRSHHEAGRPERTRVLTFTRAFHGRTLGALALTGNPAYQVGFGPPLAGIQQLPYGDLAAVEAALGDDVAAVLVEPVQGEGGVNLPPEGFLAGLRALCDAHGALLLFDEVQTGMGRTGHWLGSQAFGVRADAVSMAKGLGGGFPIGALLLDESLAGGLPPGAHGSTFGGNPLACAAARAVIDTIEQEGLLAHTTAMGERLHAGLEKVVAKHPNVCTEARGIGLLRAVGLAEGQAARDLLPVARDHGLFVTAASAHAIRFTPPLVVSPAEIDEAVEKIDATFASLGS